MRLSISKLCLMCVMLLSSGILLAQENCLANIREGVFEDSNTGHRNMITRKGDQQIEVSAVNGYKLVSTVEWLSDSIYQLELKETFGMENTTLKPGLTMEIRITECSTLYYKCIAILNGNKSKELTYTIVD